jgi:UPF0042 nucleotide-binding protein
MTRVSTTPRRGPASRSPARPPAPAAGGRVVILTGLSGAGKSQATKLFEDLGFYCVDNLPPDLLEGFLRIRDADPGRYAEVALVLDIRAGDPAAAIVAARAALTAGGSEAVVIYLEASDPVLVSRFSETRHRHPLQARRGVQAGISAERRVLAATRQVADHVIDTSALSIGQLKEQLFGIVRRDAVGGVVAVDIITFGFRFGIPLEADLVFDVRFLTNPFWVPDLKGLTGLQLPVREFVMSQPAAPRFLDLVVELMDLTLPAYRAEGKDRLTVALGCTGGYHRSTALAEELAQRLRGREDVSVAVFHRELER